MPEHRVAMLGASWRRVEDPSRSRDPRVRAVVGALATLPPPELRTEFRAELRTQLVAITSRVVAESTPAPKVFVPRPSPVPAPERSPAGRRTAAAHGSGVLALRLPRLHLGRPLAIAAALVTLLALLLGGATWMSRNALPGDTLYGLKRASEGIQLATAGGDVDKAKDYLNFARTRADEAKALAGNADNPTTAKLIASTLGSADSDVKSATALLGEQAVASKSASPLKTLQEWAPGQLSRLNTIAAKLPAGSLRQQASSSAALVAAANNRAKTLAPEVSCGCLGASGSDQLGPVPCTVCGSGPALPGLPVQTGVPASHPGGGQPVVSSTGAGQGPAVASSGGQGGSQPSGSTGDSKTPGGGLPTLILPLPTASVPVSASTCGLGATLGPLGVVIGLCPVGVHVSPHH